MRRQPLVVFATALVLAGVVGADWPHLRGPSYDGVSPETNLADTWPATGPPRVWSCDLGQGYSGFAIAEGKVFTQRQTVGGQYLLCLDANSGESIWETHYDWPSQRGGAYPGPFASPTWYAEGIYYASPSGLVGCVDAQTGTKRWSLNVREKFDGKGFSFGYASTPLVEDGRMILPVGGPTAGMVALSAEDGRTLWTAGADAASYCPAMPITFEGRRCVVGYLQNSLLIVEAATGKVWHRRPFSSGYDEHSAWPLFRDPDLLLTRPFRLSADCLRLQPGPDDTIESKPRWTNAEFSNDIVSSVLVSDHVYGFDLRQLQASRHRPSRGSFKCLEWSTGKVCWSTDRVGHASVLAADGKLFLLNDTGELILARANPERYEELARTKLFEGETCWTAPSLSNGRLYVRSPSKAICLNVGRPEGHEETPRITPAGPAPLRSSWRLDPAWLLTREREYPNDIFTTEEMSLWYAVGVLMLGVAALAGGLTQRIARRCDKPISGILVVLGLAFVFGLLGPNLLSAWADTCLFTWPVSVYCAFQAALLAYEWAERQPVPRRARWFARLGLVGFLLVDYAYFEFCKAVGMFLAWAFLFGFLPAFPFAWFGARAGGKGGKAWRIALWILLAFSAFFWGVHLFLLWKSSRTA